MKTVYKYELRLGQNKVAMPQRHRPVHFGEQSGALFLWAEVDATAKATRDFEYVVAATGQSIPDGYEHVSSVVMQCGLVWHLYRPKELRA